MSVLETRREIREADERRGFGCACCAWSSWFDEAVDWGWWCEERDDFIGQPIECRGFVPAAHGASGGRREWRWRCEGCGTYNLATTVRCRKCGESRTDDRG